MNNSNPHWAYESVFYHMYPLGFCGAPACNDFCSAAVPRLNKIDEWIPHLRSLGANALYLGPVFESSAHGYDTVDYYHVDRRLGEDQSLSRLSAALHRNGLRLILDGVVEALRVGGTFTAFQYVHAYGLPPAVAFRRETTARMRSAATAGVVLRNLPPAFVLTWVNRGAGRDRPMGG